MAYLTKRSFASNESDTLWDNLATNVSDFVDVEIDFDPEAISSSQVREYGKRMGASWTERRLTDRRFGTGNRLPVHRLFLDRLNSSPSAVGPIGRTDRRWTARRFGTGNSSPVRRLPLDRLTSSPRAVGPIAVRPIEQFTDPAWNRKTVH